MKMSSLFFWLNSARGEFKFQRHVDRSNLSLFSLLLDLGKLDPVALMNLINNFSGFLKCHIRVIRLSSWNQRSQKLLAAFIPQIDLWVAGGIGGLF